LWTIILTLYGHSNTYPVTGWEKLRRGWNNKITSSTRTDLGNVNFFLETRRSGKKNKTIQYYNIRRHEVQRNITKMENTNKRKYTMFNIMTDRWLKRRLRSPWRSTKTMGEKKRPQPGTNHGQMLLVCSVREWR